MQEIDWDNVESIRVYNGSDAADLKWLCHNLKVRLNKIEQHYPDGSVWRWVYDGQICKRIESNIAVDMPRYELKLREEL